jgi:hypothetical protein
MENRVLTTTIGLNAGTSLERLWSFAREFLVDRASGELIPDELDDTLKRTVWRYLLKHGDVIVKSDTELLHAPDKRVRPYFPR